MDDSDVPSVQDSISPLRKIQSSIDNDPQTKGKIHTPAYDPHCNTIIQLPHREPLYHLPSSSIP